MGGGGGGGGGGGHTMPPTFGAGGGMGVHPPVPTSVLFQVRSVSISSYSVKTSMDVLSSFEACIRPFSLVLKKK